MGGRRRHGILRRMPENFRPGLVGRIRCRRARAARIGLNETSTRALAFMCLVNNQLIAFMTGCVVVWIFIIIFVSKTPGDGRDGR